MSEHLREELAKLLNQYDEQRRVVLAREQKVKEEDERFVAGFAELRKSVIRPAFEAAAAILTERGHKVTVVEQEFSVDPAASVTEAMISLHIVPSGTKSTGHDERGRALSISTRHYNKMALPLPALPIRPTRGADGPPRPGPANSRVQRVTTTKPSSSSDRPKSSIASTGDDAMKVGVLTFHRCINYGSYWQARCLVEGLRAEGHDAELLDHDAPEVRRAEWRCAFQPRLPVRTPRTDFRHYAAKARKFLAAFDRLPRSPCFALERPEEAGEYDMVVIGSDEVWNFRHPWYGSRPIFFGERLRTRRLASYAASFGSHDAAQGIDPAWAAKLERFDTLSVRDENSRELVRQGLDRDPELVLDPCLQFPPPPVTRIREPAPYLALYGHGFPDWFAAAVRGWAAAGGRRVLSIGYRNDWADEQRIDAGPEDFSALIAGAEAVATNFFHGCVFALHHRRPFVCAPSTYRFNKVRDLTRALAAGRHMVNEHTPSAAYTDLLGAPLDPEIHIRITAMRAQSSAYLATALG